MNINQLNKLGFEMTGHQLSLNTNKIEFNLTTTENDLSPGVYLFTTPPTNGSVVVLYCGKAGYGLAKRLKQHQGGYRAKKSADPEYRSKLHIAMETHRAQTCCIWFRPSECRSIADVISGLPRTHQISLYSIEEEALITHLRAENYPLYNVSTPPALNPPPLPAADAPAEAVPRDLFKGVCNQVQQQKNKALAQVWRKTINTWDDIIKDRLESTLAELYADGSLEGKSAKVQKYSGGPTAQRPALMFGSLVKSRFKPRSVTLVFDVEKLFFIKYSYRSRRNGQRGSTQKEVVRVIPLFSYLDE